MTEKEERIVPLDGVLAVEGRPYPPRHRPTHCLPCEITRANVGDTSASKSKIAREREGERNGEVGSSIIRRWRSHREIYIQYTIYMDDAPAALLSRLAKAEAALLEERASKQALHDELLRLRSEQAEAAAAPAVTVDFAAHDGGSSDGRASTTAGLEQPPVVAETLGTTGGENGRSGRREEERPPWKNGLYKRQPYADNYVPDSFLEKLVTNGEPRSMALCISQHDWSTGTSDSTTDDIHPGQ